MTMIFEARSPYYQAKQIKIPVLLLLEKDVPGVVDVKQRVERWLDEFRRLG